MGSNQASTPLIVVGAGGFNVKRPTAVPARCLSTEANTGSFWASSTMTRVAPTLRLTASLCSERSRLSEHVPTPDLSSPRVDRTDFTSRLPHRQAPRPAEGPICVNRASGCVDLGFHDDRRRHSSARRHDHDDVGSHRQPRGDHAGSRTHPRRSHTIEDYATIASGVRLGGTVHIGTGAYIGAGALVREGVSIGAWSMIGMGSVVTRDVPAGQLWFGSPARNRRKRPGSARAARRRPRSKIGRSGLRQAPRIGYFSFAVRNRWMMPLPPRGVEPRLAVPDQDRTPRNRGLTDSRWCQPARSDYAATAWRTTTDGSGSTGRTVT